jgi:lysophospholipase L1-like esterase
MITIFWIAGPLQRTSAAITHATYTALGDSIAFGLWAPPGEGYVPLYAGYIQSDLSLPVTLIPLGVPGWTSGDLLNAVKTNWTFRLSIFGSNVLTWNIGGNDLRAARTQYKGGSCGGLDNQDCLKMAVATFETNWDLIVKELFALRKFRPTVFRTMDIYNPYVLEDMGVDSWPNDQGTDFDVLNLYLNQVNAYIAASSLSPNHPFLYAPVHAAFNGSGTTDPATLGLLAFDGFHPNALGHAVIAYLLRGLGYASVIPL